MKRLALFIFLAYSAEVFSQMGVRFIPRVSVGYNFGAGIDFGTDLGVTFGSFRVGKEKCAAGINASLDLFHGSSFVAKERASWYRLFCLHALGTVNDNFMLKLGMGRTWTRWGMEDRNKSRHIGWGLSADVAYAPFDNVFFGYHYSKVSTHCVGLVIKRSNILYASYAFPVNIRKGTVALGTHKAED